MRSIALFLATVLTAVMAPASAVEHEHQHHNADMSTPLTAPGNDAFAAIQEAEQKLLADPNTDWSRVNLEALRQHLVDMQNFTFNVEITDQHNIDNGVAFTVSPTTPGAAASLARLFSAHPAVLKQESGWDMVTEKSATGVYQVRVTSALPGDAPKIRGLGYIGIVAYGSHHPSHHWQMATGKNPHSH